MHKFGSVRNRTTSRITLRTAASGNFASGNFASGRTPLLRWIVPTNLDHRPVKISSKTWRVFCQESFVIVPKTTKTVKLPIGVELSDGVILTSLAQDLKVKRCSLQNELTLSSVNNVVVTIQNNSDREVSILEGTPMCLVSYAK